MPPEVQSDFKKSLAFLKAIYGDHCVNVVAIDPQTEIVTGLSKPVYDPEIESFIASNIDKRNLYYSVNSPHSGAPDKKLTKEHIGLIHAVWIDADPKPCPEGIDFKEHFKSERRRLLQFAKKLMDGENPPTVIVDSGGGIQAFWFLEHPVAVTPDTKTHYEGINRALAKLHGTDSVHNIDRIMRLPYTWNIPTKKKKGRSKALAKCTRIGRMYREIDWIEPAEATESENDHIDYAALDWKKVTDPLEGELQARFEKARKRNRKIDDLWNGRLKHLKPTRSEADFTLAKELKSEGFDLSDTGCIMYNFPYGKGKELNRREITRCYERSGVDFEDTVDQETIDRIAKQVNPILAARAAGKSLEEDLRKTHRFRAVKLHEMDWKKSGKPIYRDFIYEKAITVIYGKSNTGKSFLTTDIAGHVALGRNWNGMKFESEEVPAVVYICAEAGQSFAIRGQALMHRLGVKELPFFVITEAPAFVSDDKADAKAIVEEIKRIERENDVRVGIVVVDTLAVTFQGDENSSKDMGVYVKNMKYIQHEANTGVLIVHHSGKDQTAGARGSSALQAATDTEMEVKSEKRGERYNRKVEVKKQRTGKAGMEVKFGLFVKELGKDNTGAVIDSCYVVLKDDNEFGDVFADDEKELSKNARAVSDAIKFYDAIPSPEMDRLTERQIKIIIHHDIVKGNRIFDMKQPDKAISELFAMKKPTDAMDRAFSRGCKELTNNGADDRKDEYQTANG